MKKIIASFFFLFTCFQVGFSQGFSYLNNTSEWRYDGSSQDGLNEYDILYTVYFDGSETINGISYFKEYRLKYMTTYYWDGSIVSDTNLFGPLYRREDSSGKFYIYNSFTNSDDIYFDNQLVLNAQIGSPFPLFQGSTCSVQNIETVYLGTQPLKKINGSLISASTGSVEGIGEVYPSCNLPIEGNPTLVCYSKDSLFIQFKPMDCSLFPVPVRVNDNSNSKFENHFQEIKLYPNPTTDAFTIKGITQGEVSIYSIMGQFIAQQSFDAHTKIDLSQLQKGMYLVKLKGHPEAFMIQKD